MLESKGYHQSEREPMLKRDVAVIEAAETLVQKWREFDNNGQAEDPEDYAEALIRAVIARKEDLKPTTTVADLTTPSITVGTQVRLTGVVTSIYDDGSGEVALRGGEIGTTIDAKEMASAEVIRQPFKRGEVVYYVGDKDSEPLTVVTDEAEEFVLLARHVHGTETLEWDATTFERRP